MIGTTAAVAASATGPDLLHRLGNWATAHPFVALPLCTAVAVLFALGLRLAAERLGPGRRGFATGRQLRRSLSLAAARKTIPITRPSLRGRDAEPREYAIHLGRAIRTPRRLYGTCRDVILVVAPPQTGKTAWLSGAVIDAPGATYVTSTKADVYEHTVRHRERQGPVAVFNPDHVGAIDSTFRWSPITGCTDPAVAMRRAGYLLAGSPTTKGAEDRTFWQGNAFKILRAYLWAAAANEADMQQLTRWVMNGTDTEPLSILKDPRAPEGWADEVEQVMTHAPDNTRESVYITLALTFAFMGDPGAAQTVLPTAGNSAFDTGQFVRERGTLYLLGAEREHGGVAPLLTCLAGEVFETAKHLASLEPTGRLDPPLMPALDEAALICPVPLPRWTSDAGGRGIPLVIAVQSPSQLYDRWGRQGGQTIWNNSNIKMVFGGLTIKEHLDELVTVCGERDERTITTSRGADGSVSRSRSYRRVPVMPADAIRTLPDWRALVLHRNTRPVLARVTPVWKRRDLPRLRPQEAPQPAPKLAPEPDTAAPAAAVSD